MPVTDERPSSVVSWVSAVAALAFFVSAAAFFWQMLFGRATAFVFTDLDYYRAALRVVVAQQPLYAALPYPPVAVLVIAWLGGLSVIQGNQLWTAMEFVLVTVLAVVLARRSLPDRRLQDPRLLVRVGIAGTLLLASMSVSSQLTNGQVSLIVISLAFLDVARVLPQRLQGVLVGAAAAIKLTPLVFLPYYLVTGQRRQAAVAAGSFVGFSVLGFAVFPSDSVFFWAHLGKSDQFGDPTRLDNLSLHSMLMRWVPSVGQYSASWLLLGAAVLVLALWQARRHYLRGEWLSSALVVGAAASVVGPIAWPHYLVWTVLAGTWLLFAPRARARLVGAGILMTTTAAFSVLMALWVGLSAPAYALVDLQVVVPMLIGLCGLPERNERSTTDGRLGAHRLKRSRVQPSEAD